MPLVEQELLIRPEHLSSSPVFSRVRVTRSLVLCVCFVDTCLSFFLLAIVLSVLLLFTDSDCPFGVSKLLHLLDGIFAVNSFLLFRDNICSKKTFLGGNICSKLLLLVNKYICSKL